MKLDAIGIVAHDLNESMKFYRLLGLDFPDHTTEDHVEAHLPSGLRIMLDSEKLMRELKPDWVKPVGQRMALAFLCKSPRQVDEVYARVCTAGYRGAKEPWDAFWGQRYATVMDPDGNHVDLFAPLS